MGRFEEAEEQIRRGLEIEPHSPVIAHESAFNAFRTRRHNEEMERSRKGLKNDPDYWLLRYWLALAHQFEGRHAEAIEEMETGGLGNAYAAAGNRAEAMRVLDELLAMGDRQSIDFAAVAMIYAGLGDVENALKYLEKACDARGMVTIFIKVDPRFDALRGMPRFQNILTRLNLA